LDHENTSRPPRHTDTSPVVPALWRRPGWLRAPMLAVMWSALLIYGSLLPWDFDLNITGAGGITPAIVGWITSPAWVPAVTETSSLGVPNWVSDLVTNLLLYGPLGVLLRLTLSRLNGSQVFQIVSAVVAIASLSWLIESTQSLIPGRYASLQDVFANTLGGSVGVLLGHRVNSTWRAGAFTLFRWTAGPMGLLTHRLHSHKPRPTMMFIALAVNVGLIAWWYMLSSGSTATTHSGQTGVYLVPFERYFERSYDVAAVLLGRSLIVYCLAGAVWMLTMMHGHTRKALGWVVLTAALTAATVEGLKLIGPGADADVTEPLIALIAGGLVLTAAFMLVHACRSSCRRLEQLPVENDRRRHGHDYRFSLGTDKVRINRR
jgi:VanZ family protein